VPVGSVHDVKDFVNVIRRHLLMEQIAHRVDEDNLRLFPFERRFEGLSLNGELETVLVVGLAHGFEARCHALGIAVLASRADLCAAGDGIPGGLGPFDGGFSGHRSFQVYGLRLALRRVQLERLKQQSREGTMGVRFYCAMFEAFQQLRQIPLLVV